MIDKSKGSSASGRRGKSRAMPEPASADGTTAKLAQIVALLARAEGASIVELASATGWQAHSIRGALAGALKRKGHVILSEKAEGERRCRIGAPQ